MLSTRVEPADTQGSGEYLFALRRKKVLILLSKHMRVLMPLFKHTSLLILYIPVP